MFVAKTTVNPNEATSLFLEAAESVPIISDDEVRSEFNTLMNSSWASQKLFKGNVESLSEIIRGNFNKFSKLKDFSKFQVHVVENQNCAQVETIIGNFFYGTRLWRTKDSLYVCGNSAFHDIE